MAKPQDVVGIVSVLRSDYQMLLRLATDRLASLDAAFPPEVEPGWSVPVVGRSQTGLSWRRRLAVQWVTDASGADRLPLGYEEGDRLA